MANVDELRVEVEASAGQASSAVRQLAEDVRTLRSSVTRALAPLGQLRDAIRGIGAAGDWVQVEWSAPVQGRIEVRTGLPDGTLRLSKGRVEVSADGRMWSRVGTVSSKTGVCAFRQRTGIRFLRLLPEPRSPETLAVREIAVRP